MLRTLLVEPQALFAPYFAGVLARDGAEVVVAKRAPKRLLRSLRPELVVLDVATTGRRPLQLIENVRTALPSARIVVFARSCEPVWATLANAFGADAVVGPSAREADLLGAIAR